MWKLLAMTCILTAGTCACGGSGPATVAPPGMNAAVVGSASVAQPLKVTVIGDSVSHGANEVPQPGNDPYPTQLATLGYNVINLAQNWAHTAQVTATQVPLIDADSALVVIEIGTNDLPTANLSDLDALGAAVRAKVPNARLVFATVRNYALLGLDATVYADYYGQTADAISATVRVWNGRIREVAARYGGSVFEMESDPQWFNKGEWVAPEYVHPLASGAARIARALSLMLH